MLSSIVIERVMLGQASDKSPVLLDCSCLLWIIVRWVVSIEALGFYESCLPTHRDRQTCMVLGGSKFGSLDADLEWTATTMAKNFTLQSSVTSRFL